jgi:hypothetical protein
MRSGIRRALFRNGRLLCAAIPELTGRKAVYGAVEKGEGKVRGRVGKLF